MLPGLITITGNLLGGWWVLSNLIFSIGFLALVEWFMPEDKSQEHSASPFIPDLILVLHALLQILSLTALFYSLHAGRIVGWQIFWVAVSTGVHSGSSSLIIAHEMIHRKKKHWQMLGKMLLFSVSNVYFYVDHLRVHHKWVGTERDPATAKYGESLYAFFLRSTFGQIASAWKVEVNRLKSEKTNPYGFRNYVLTNTLLFNRFYISLVVLLGKVALLVFLLQSLVANFF
ncbi:MAG: fatty acid desaturase [Bacteroidetes bacterium]|nr:fatty acid desaturase [Bacteroidota bacterium]